MHSHCPQGWPHGLNHAVRMLGDEGFPRFGTVGLDGLLALIEVAQRSREGIGRVEQGGHLSLVDVQRALQHQCHLLFAGGAIACDGHLDLARLILGDGNLAVQGGDHRHTLGTAQLEHRLHVLAIEWGLNRHLVGQVLGNHTAHALIDVPQLHVVVLHAAQLQHAHDNELGCLAVHPQQGITHHIGARVDADDDILVLVLHFFSCWQR